MQNNHRLLLLKEITARCYNNNTRFNNNIKMINLTYWDIIKSHLFIMRSHNFQQTI